MRIIPKIAGFVLVTLLIGCEEKVRAIDTSTDESMERTTNQIRESLTSNRLEEFDEALEILALSQINLEGVFSGAFADPTVVERRVKEMLHGRTADEIIAEADRILLERQAKEREQALAEIEELQSEKEAAELARIELLKFEVLRSRFYKREREFGRPEPIIELTVRNGTSDAVSRAYFEGTIASPNRSVPWLQETFNYSISGGLEPGEEASWTLVPNSFSDWGTVDAPEDAIFTVTAYKIDGADGVALYAADEFSEFDQIRLDELLEQFSN